MIPLNDLNATHLAQEVLQLLKPHLEYPELNKIKSASLWAADLHHNDTRKAPVKRSDGSYAQGVVPYIEHPYRVALRLVRWGVKEPCLVAAALLHDVVEDHADDIAKVSCSYRKDDPEFNRAVALQVIHGYYSARASELVSAVSNPIVDVADKEERRKVYAEHVSEAIASDARAFLIKFSDFVDNALSLHNHPNKSSRRYFAKRYQPLANAYKDAFYVHQEELKEILSAVGVREIQSRVESANAYLSDILVKES